MACVEDSAPSGRSASTLEIQEVLGEQFTREVEFMQLRAIEIDKCHTQAALQLTEVTRKATLPNNLQYLRMCKSIDNNRILLIYGTSADIPCRGDLESRGINIYAVHTVEVPKYSPCTTEQYRQWSKYWPLKYLKPKVTPVQITHALKEKMLTMMSMVVQESQRENNRAVCIITYKDRTIAKAIDERGTNILNHAALLAVRQVAKSQQNDPKLMVNAKKRFVGHSQETKSDCDPGVGTEAEIPDYLCTQCEVFISHEPCCMCAMALLHSRVASVTYYYPNKRMGALGSVYSIHNNRQLNHHFRAFAVKQYINT